jgi:hypothetical protein
MASGSVEKSEPFTPELRDILIEHMEGKPIPFDAPMRSVRRRLTRILLTRGFLQPLGTMEEPSETVMTERGHDALCAMLGDYADALFRAGYGDLAHDRSHRGPRSRSANGTPAATLAGIAMRSFLTTRSE